MNSINSNTSSCALLLDLSKAFDLVDHSILIRKMERYGIRGSAQKWFESYLSNRKQITRVTKLNETNNTLENFDSKPLANHCGVPQGSILGPLLFLIYINDLPQAIKHQCVLFADDTTVIIESKNPQDYDTIINESLNDITKWLDINKLRINVMKTNVLRFKTWKSKHINLNIAYDGTMIEHVNSARFLGVFLDEHLTWKNHIENICNKINKFVFALRKVKDITSKHTAIHVYHAYVCSVIRYGIIVWGNSVDISRVFIAQKKCIRAIFNLKWSESCRPVFQSNKLLTVPSIYIYEVAKFIRANPALFEVKDNVNKRKATRVLLQMPVPRLELFRRNCVYMAPLIYNTLPKSITELPYKKFCITLKKWLIKENYYSVQEFLVKNKCKSFGYIIRNK